MNNDIKIYGVLQNNTVERTIAYSEQIFDQEQGKFQDEINRAATGNYDILTPANGTLTVDGNFTVTGDIDLDRYISDFVTAHDISTDGEVVNGYIKRIVYRELSGQTQSSAKVMEIVDNEIAKVVANAPQSFDTLREIADWIATHSEDASAMNSAILQNAADISNARLQIASLISRDAQLENNINGLTEQYYTKSEVNNLINGIDIPEAGIPDTINKTLMPDEDGVYNIGSEDCVWNDVYATTIHAGNASIDNLNAVDATITYLSAQHILLNGVDIETVINNKISSAINAIPEVVESHDVIQRVVVVSEDMSSVPCPVELSDGQQCHVIYRNTTDDPHTVSASNSYISPDNEQLSIEIPAGSYGEINYMKIGDDIFVRGI